MSTGCVLSSVTDSRQSCKLRGKKVFFSARKYRGLGCGEKKGPGVFRKFMARSSNPVEKPVSDDITGFFLGGDCAPFPPQKEVCRVRAIVDLYGKCKVLLRPHFSALIGGRGEEVQLPHLSLMNHVR